MAKIAILGLGVVGGGTADLLTENREKIRASSGEYLDLKYVLDIRDMPDSPYRDLIVHDIAVIENDPEVSIVAETIGGVKHAYEHTVRLLKAGKSVVTSNKQLVSEHGAELLALAKEHGCRYLFEASTGGGIPVIGPLSRDLSGNEISEISGILNGTTNYILTRMRGGGVGFETALSEAQKKGYAERDPSADVEGTDACRKIAILAATAFSKLIPPSRIHTEGITAIRQSDVSAAASVGAAVKLLGRAIRRGGECFVMVAPFFVPNDSPLSHVDGVYNAISVTGNYVGDVMFYGRGAGAKATASAVVADLIEAASGAEVPPVWVPAEEGFPTEFGTFSCPRYLAFSGVDQNAVRVVFGEVTFIRGAEGEVAFLTSQKTECECADGIARLSVGGGQLLSMIRVYESGESPEA
ncbi:MAG: homoserine dehydrogenase [Clostridia bacterium]|nr:homoserine dehydrogenase [Clostridia bacterium]